jgi:uncharacterized tellurite resistance protein B-like protein
LLSSLKNFFSQSKGDLPSNDNDLNLVCGLLVEAANIDGKIEQIEINKISEVLVDSFQEDPFLVEKELKQCLDELNDHKSLHFYTSRINKLFENRKKLLLIEILWEIILADGLVHDFESNLIRRLAGLLYISDIDSGKIKKKVLENLKYKKKEYTKK